MLQHQVRMPEASRSGRNRDLDVSSPSPSPVYIRLIWKQAAQVSDSETERKVEFDGFFYGNREKLGASGKALAGPACPAGVLHLRGRLGVL